MEHGCGQCMPCRINRRRLWTCRLQLECYLHKHSLFVTLTYSPEHLPVGNTLVPRDAKLYLMRLRKALGRPFRYFLVGEYGERSQRAHYHCLLFGVSETDVVVSKWGLGHVHIGTVTDASAAYVTGYCTKAFSTERLNGRHPEFARMSLNPAIGLGAIPIIAGAVRQGGSRYIADKLDVPRELRIAGKKMDIGRYLVNKLRLALDRPSGCPEVLLGVKQQEFWTKLRNAEAWAAHQARRRHDYHRAMNLNALQRMKGTL